MSVHRDPRHISRPWRATARLRSLRKDVYLGSFATKEEAQAAVSEYYGRKYGPGDGRRGQLAEV